MFLFLTIIALAYLSVFKDWGGGLSAPLCISGLVWVSVLNPFRNNMSGNGLPYSKGFM